jgi:hypothetical protein
VTIAPPVHDHFVKFYDGEHDFVEGVGPFLAEGLRGGEMTVVIATEQHRRLIAEYLRDAGIPVDLVEDRGDYVALDAAAVLRSFMVNGTPDRNRFRDAIVPFANAASAKRQSLRAFGEMVGLLWKAGNVKGAVRLERLWNEVVDGYGLTLYCAYSARMLGDTADIAATAEMCATHNHLISPAHYDDAPAASAPSGQVSKSFLPTPEALAAARWFVLSTLQAWEHSAFSVGAVSVATAHLVTSVLHNNLQPFRITLRREIHGVRVELEHPADFVDGDAGNEAYAELVHRLATEWGTNTKADTNVVWATFAA